MSENIGAIDWFTKTRINDITYPEQSDVQLDDLIRKIIQVFNNSKRMKSLAQGIYDIIEQDPFLGEISSDSRLPVCSLFHHMKNTSGIAVCLAFQKMDGAPDYISTCIGEYGVTSEYKEPDFISLIRLASLLHDIGKPRSYTSESKYQRYHYHTRQTREIIEKILSETTSPLIETMGLKNILPQLASKHHSRDASTKLEKLISRADTIASAADRIYEVKGKFNDGSITIKCNDNIFPHEINFDAGDLKCSETPHTVIFGRAEEKTRNVELKSGVNKSAQLFVDSTVHGGPVQYLSNTTYHHSGSIGILSLDVMGIQGFINEADKLKMLRGGSAIVDDTLNCAIDIISKEVCKEAILFAGGGNLLAFVPNTKSRMDSIAEKIKVEIEKISKNGLSSAVVTFEAPLNKVGGNFGDVLQDSQNKLKTKKNETRERQIVPNTRTVCNFCFKREKPESSKMCATCKIKEETGKQEKFETSKKYISDTYGLQTPIDLTHIGNSIAVIVIDGNMMGRMFQQTTTPAEYTYKSHRFSSKFDDIIRSTIHNFIEEPNNRQLITNQIENENYLGIDVLYAGGDDVLIIMNAKGAVQFTEMLVNNVAEEFTFEKKFLNGTTFKNPIVTLSCGIAIADNKFPIHFLLNAARNMESKAKEQFRHNTETDDFGIIKIPKGAIAVTAISSAMPSSEYNTFVLGNDENGDNNDLLQLNNMINFALNKNRTLISDIITCGTSEHERLNLIKYMYSSIQRKTRDVGLDDCEWMADVLLNDDVLKASKMIIPHLWHDNEEVRA